MADADLWIMAAKCEMEDRDSSESARHLFLRALRFHPESKKVYQEVSERETEQKGGKKKQKQNQKISYCQSQSAVCYLDSRFLKKVLVVS